jgi:hypothetical protein
MTMPQTIYHKRNELLEVESYKDEECTEAFDFTNAKNLYINGQFDLQVVNSVIEETKIEDTQIFIPYIPQDCINSIMSAIISRNCDNEEPDDYDNVKVFTLTQIDKMWDEDKIETITPNFSKYIPKDNAVLFLSEEDSNNYKISESFIIQNNNIPILYTGLALTCMPPIYCTYKKATIFLSHGTQSELQKANEVEKELKEKYGVEEVNLFALHWFIPKNGWREIGHLL